jgi:hypothetical protein
MKKQKKHKREKKKQKRTNETYIEDKRKGRKQGKEEKGKEQDKGKLRVNEGQKKKETKWSEKREKKACRRRGKINVFSRGPPPTLPMPPSFFLSLLPSFSPVSFTAALRKKKEQKCASVERKNDSGHRPFLLTTANHRLPRQQLPATTTTLPHSR